MLTAHIIIYQVGKGTPPTRRVGRVQLLLHFSICALAQSSWEGLPSSTRRAECTQLRCFFPYAPLRIKKVRLCGPIQIYILLLTPLPIYLIHQYRSRHRRIKRLNSSLHRYLHPYISHLSCLFCQSFRLISNQYR